MKVSTKQIINWIIGQHFKISMNIGLSGTSMEQKHYQTEDLPRGSVDVYVD